MKKEVRMYRYLNEIAKNECVVLFGSDTFSRIPVLELSAGYELTVPVYNRSISGIRIEECEKVLKECIFELNPDKIFLNIGESDVESDVFDADVFVAKYEWLLYTVHSHCKSRIYVVSILSENPRTAYVNEKLRRISKNCGCSFIDISAAVGADSIEIGIYEIIRCHFRLHPISMIEAFSVAK